MIPPDSVAPWTHDDNGPTRSDATGADMNMGSCFYWGPIKRRSQAYHSFDVALDSFDDRWQSFGCNITNGLRMLARKLDDTFGGER